MTVELPPKPMLTEIPGRSAVGESDDRATTDPTDPKGRAVPWRPKLLPVEDRRSIMDTLMVTLSGGALWRFAALMVCPAWSPRSACYRIPRPSSSVR
ncbi:hypothetical protein [Mycobacterium ulcerans]|uniref:hypothetical protein n=1 Tax=Mycobacterium ulcerans TaxID=1809 RepID=UPI001E2CCDF4|nr:hypothetical protein [Mycobacterium ulcerans]